MSDVKTNAVHEDLDRQEVIKGSSDRGFGIVFTVVSAIVGLWPLLSGENPRNWALAAAGFFLLATLVRPSVLAPLNWVWTRFGLVLHKVTNPIIMGVVFFGTVMPIGLIMRGLGKDPLSRKLDRQARTYWMDRVPPGPSPESMKNQF